MINFKPKIPAMLGALAVLTAGAAHAELLEYTFKAPDGTQRSLTPNANYANPTGNISFALSAGIDRKVKISVIRSDGTVVSTATSHLLGATDRITVGGKSYYGCGTSTTGSFRGSLQTKGRNTGVRRKFRSD
ncbi:putative periplasmic protein [Escherichia coli]|nr:putative periplasmic protein [Escherichia coli]